MHMPIADKYYGDQQFIGADTFPDSRTPSAAAVVGPSPRPHTEINTCCDNFCRNNPSHPGQLPTYTSYCCIDIITHCL
ncbi:protein of unknown function [Magnetospirillum sp. XM-1]|nr:protein of unknown function [Magnetospirillum sp. XM-1]